MKRRLWLWEGLQECEACMAVRERPVTLSGCFTGAEHSMMIMSVNAKQTGSRGKGVESMADAVNAAKGRHTMTIAIKRRAACIARQAYTGVREGRARKSHGGIEIDEERKCRSFIEAAGF